MGPTSLADRFDILNLPKLFSWKRRRIINSITKFGRGPTYKSATIIIRSPFKLETFRQVKKEAEKPLLIKECLIIQIIN